MSKWRVKTEGTAMGVELSEPSPVAIANHLLVGHVVAEDDGEVGVG